MPAPFSRDLRERIIQAIEQGGSSRTIAERFEVSERTITRYRRCYQETGSLHPRPNHGRPARLVIESDRLGQQLTEHPTATLAEHCRHWSSHTGQPVSITTMWRAIRGLGWTRKKDSGSPGTGRDRPGCLASGHQHPE